jgi:hypothetical protein
MQREPRVIARFRMSRNHAASSVAKIWQDRGAAGFCLSGRERASSRGGFRVTPFRFGVRLRDWNRVERLRIDFLDQCGLSLANDCFDLPTRGDGSFRSLHGLRLSLANGDVEARRPLIGRI